MFRPSGDTLDNMEFYHDLAKSESGVVAVGWPLEGCADELNRPKPA